MAKKAKAKKRSKTKSKTSKPLFENEVLFYVYHLIIITIALIGGLNVGLVGNFLSNIMRYVVGEMYIITFALIILGSLYLMVKKNFANIQKRYIFVCIIFFLICLTFLSSMLDINMVGMDVIDYYTRNSEFIFNGTFSVGGGIIGATTYGGLSMLFGKTGTYIVLVFLTLVSLLIVLSAESRKKLGRFFLAIPKVVAKPFKRSDVKNIEDDSEPEFFQYEEEEVPVEDYADLLNNPTTEQPSLFMDVDDVANTKEKDVEETRPVLAPPLDETTAYPVDFRNYRLPKLNLLSLPKKSGKSGANTSAANEAGKRLIHILHQFGVKATLVATHIGPSVTKFELKPEVGIRVSKISGLQQDIKMGLAAKDIRIEAPIPGKSTVGIEIPNQEKTIVNMRDLMRLIPSGSEDKKLLFALGKDLMGNCVYGELNKMPHLLIAGATGSGKSVCVNSIVTSILMRAKPDEVKMLLIDPKKGGICTI